MMNQQQATDYVIKALGRHQSSNIILETICTETGMNWEEAKSFVRKVIAENSDKIVVKQSPLFLILGIGFIIIGIFMALAGLRTMWSTIVRLWNS